MKYFSNVLASIAIICSVSAIAYADSGMPKEAELLMSEAGPVVRLLISDIKLNLIKGQCRDNVFEVEDYGQNISIAVNGQVFSSSKPPVGTSSGDGVIFLKAGVSCTLDLKNITRVQLSFAHSTLQHEVLQFGWEPGASTLTTYLQGYNGTAHTGKIISTY
jgi:hypothetical protein